MGTNCEPLRALGGACFSRSMKPPAPSHRHELLDAAVGVVWALAVGVPAVLFVEWTPSAWLRVLDVLGPSPRPWLLGAIILALVLPSFLFLVVILRSVLHIMAG